VPLRDIRTIVETLAANARQSQDAGVLTAAVRIALSRLIFQQINALGGDLPVITLDPALEQILQNSLQTTGGSEPVFEPGLAERVHRAIADAAQKQELSNQPGVLLVPAGLRAILAKFVRRTIPTLHVLSYNELPDNKRIKVVASIGGR